MSMLSKFKCKKCGSHRIKHWHYYSKYGGSGAWHCKDCGALFKGVMDRKTRRLKMGRFIKMHQVKEVLKAKAGRAKFYRKRKKK